MLRYRPTRISLTDHEIHNRLELIEVEQAILTELENLEVSDSNSYERLESGASASSSTPGQSSVMTPARSLIYDVDSAEKVKSCYTDAASTDRRQLSTPASDTLGESPSTFILNAITSPTSRATKPEEGNEDLKTTRRSCMY
jgi:hypothetical protein